MTLQMVPLFSGSKGNATYVEAGSVKLLVDAGVSAKRLDCAFAAMGVNPGELDGVLITHEHSDHINGLNIFATRHDLRVFANGPTWQAMAPAVNRLRASQRVVIDVDSDFYMGALNVETFSIPHDAACPMGYGFILDNVRGMYLTDLGCITKKLFERMLGANIILLESNHDEQMLLSGRYPEHLKRRIYGQRGHLSNRICGEALRRLVQAGLSQAGLMHLSDENNTPALAHETVRALLAQDGIQEERDIKLIVGAPDGPVGALGI